MLLASIELARGYNGYGAVSVGSFSRLLPQAIAMRAFSQSQRPILPSETKTWDAHDCTVCVGDHGDRLSKVLDKRGLPWNLAFGGDQSPSLARSGSTCETQVSSRQIANEWFEHCDSAGAPGHLDIASSGRLRGDLGKALVRLAQHSVLSPPLGATGIRLRPERRRCSLVRRISLDQRLGSFGRNPSKAFAKCVRADKVSDGLTVFVSANFRVARMGRHQRCIGY
jgi:hypothetical protein